MMTRIVKQIKKVEIYREGYYIDGGMGFIGTTVPREVYYSGDYTTEADISKKFQEAKERFNEQKKEPFSWIPYDIEVKKHEWWENLEILD